MAKRIFISFAIEDVRYRDFLVGQSKNDKCPFEFVDMSVKEPWKTEWRIRCRSKMKGCDGVIALLSKNTAAANGAIWEMQCANEEKIPMVGVYIDRNNKPNVPAELKNHQVIEWTWDGIKKFINSL